MASRSHVVRRGRRLAGPAFPLQPTLPLGEAYPGVALVVDAADETPDLRGLRSVIAGLWRGALYAGPGAPQVLVVSFTAPTLVEAEMLPGALPLIHGHAGSLVSFREEPERPEASPVAAVLRRVELWWSGRRRAVAVETLNPVPLETLWDLPRLYIHAADAPPMAVPATTRDGEPRRTAGELAPISRSSVALKGSTQDLAGAIDDSLADLDRRTRLGAIFRQMFLGQGGGGSGPGGQAGPWGAPAEPKGPGVLQNLAGWLRWHTPLGNPLRRSMSERMRMVERLIAAGDLDSALRMALTLGGKDSGQRKTILPNAMPEIRGSLDFGLSSNVFAAPILGQDTYYHLRQRYSDLADRLEREGDYRRAAYIHAKLLNDHRRAVGLLETGGMIREAAKLAIDAKLPPALAVRLLYKAGELDAALTLAKQAGCFEDLAMESKGKDAAFHAYVIKAWTDLLLATDQPLRALQVTDDLAGELAGAGLQEARMRWLAAALRLAGDAGPGGELTVRVLLNADWRDDLSTRDIEDFPDIALVGGSGDFPQVLVALQRRLTRSSEADPQDLVDLLTAFGRLADPERADQAAFWRRPARPIVEGFVCAFVATGSARLGQGELGVLRRLLDQARLPVLATDIGKLTRLHRSLPGPGKVWTPPAATGERPVARRACVLANGNLVVWRENDILQLLDRQGALVWEERVSAVIGLVAVGSSPNVLVLQAGHDGAVQLSRLASHQRRLHPIGACRMTAWHDITSESQWLVQIGGEIGPLDLGQLCAARPQIHFLWASALTERVRVIAFAHHPNQTSWITVDQSEGRAGVIELWDRTAGGEVTTSVLTPVEVVAGEPPPPTDWYWASYMIGPVRDGNAKLTRLPWSYGREKEAIAMARRRFAAGYDTIDRFWSCDQGRPYVRTGTPRQDETGMVSTALHDPSDRNPLFALDHAPELTVACLALSPAFEGVSGAGNRPSRTCLFADDLGRLFVVDVATRNVVLI